MHVLRTGTFLGLTALLSLGIWTTASAHSSPDATLPHGRVYTKNVLPIPTYGTSASSQAIPTNLLSSRRAKADAMAWAHTNHFNIVISGASLKTRSQMESQYHIVSIKMPSLLWHITWKGLTTIGPIHYPYGGVNINAVTGQIVGIFGSNSILH